MGHKGGVVPGHLKRLPGPQTGEHPLHQEVGALIETEVRQVDSGRCAGWTVHGR
ncbi:hypothetical protein GCM10011583_55810 [Streptomyces camponoticapitis]|uniref:Uncharacterized protein n=1 Tax=Streptomyces camponoticapitis TaxID=1616125 RepID=A0ABQ2EPY3_9ACTN|nr:hypothetical protein GCM10011583_55810 [Streptomyces camponoticapitis]